jgi:hypothetical protein
MMLTKIPILHKPIPMKHRHWNYYYVGQVYNIYQVMIHN